jgi:uncharacterized protein YukE
MRICNLSDGLGQLTHAMSELNQRWSEVRGQWNDQASRDFDETYLRPIPGQMQALVAAVQALAATAEKAERDLSDPDKEM